MTLLEAIRILGLSEGLDPQRLKARFRDLAMKFHPDRNPTPEAVESFRATVAAYELIIENFAEYTRHFSGSTSDRQSLHKPSKQDHLDHEDVFDEIFGFSASGRILGRGEPQDLVLTLEELCHGTRLKRKILAYIKCGDCEGTGAMPASPSPRICRYCFGQGEVVQRGIKYESRKTCSRCHGRGREISQPCKRCDGFARLPIHRRQEIKIPSGMLFERVYALPAVDIKTSMPSQVFVKICVAEHPIFKIENYDLLCEYETDLSRLHERQVVLDTPLGNEPLLLTAQIADGTWLTIPGKGLCANHDCSVRGDLRVRLRHKRPSFFRRLFGGRH